MPCDEVFHVRRARPDDARGIAEVNVATWREAYRDILPADHLSGLSVDTRTERWSHNIDVVAPERRPWVAEAASGVVGFISSGPARDDELPTTTGEVYAIYVLPDCWDRGLGRTLLAHAERDLLGHGYSEAVLWCLEENVRARRFYELLGWQSDGSSKLVEFGGKDAAEVRYRIVLDRPRVSA